MQSIPQLVELVRATLRDEIANELQTDHARSQLAGILDVLATMERMVAWAPDWLRERLAALNTGLEAVTRVAEAAGQPLPLPLAPVKPGQLQADLEEAVAQAEQQIAGIIDWLFRSGSMLPDGVHDELDKVVRHTLRQALLADRRRVAPADFSAMTAPSP